MKEIYLMNPYTGSVQTKQEWADEGFTKDDGLLEVEKDGNGDWVEAK